MGTEVLTVTAEDKQQPESGSNTPRDGAPKEPEKAASQDQAKSKDGKPAPEAQTHPQPERGQALQALLRHGQPAAD